MTVRGWHQDAEHAVIGERHIRGGFIPNNTSSPATTYGVGFTVVRSNVGIWVVTLDEPFGAFLGVNLTRQEESSAAASFDLSLGAVSVANKTFEVVRRASATGTKTDQTANGVLRIIWFDATVARNNIPGVNGLTA